MLLLSSGFRLTTTHETSARLYMAKSPALATIIASTVGLALSPNLPLVGTSFLSVYAAKAESVPALSRLFPANGLRRVTSTAKAYSYLVPDDWQPDQRVLANQLRLSEVPYAQRRDSPLQGLPDSAWISPLNPINNFSVIKSSVQEGFGLRKTLGPPPDALQFLSKSLAPEGSGKTVTIVAATESVDALGNIQYVFEYIVNKPAWRTGRHTISIVAFSRPTDLYTATLVAPEDQWGALGSQGRRIAESFQLLSAR